MKRVRGPSVLVQRVTLSVSQFLDWTCDGERKEGLRGLNQIDEKACVFILGGRVSLLLLRARQIITNLILFTMTEPLNRA